MVDAATKAAVGKIPQLKTNAGPRDKEAWVKRLKEEYTSLIAYVQSNKESDTDWFRLESNKEGNTKVCRECSAKPQNVEKQIIA